MPEITSLITPMYKHMGSHRWAFDACSFLVTERVKNLKVKGVRHLDGKTFILLSTPNPDAVYTQVLNGLRGGGR